MQLAISPNAASAWRTADGQRLGICVGVVGQAFGIVKQHLEYAALGNGITRAARDHAPELGAKRLEQWAPIGTWSPL